MRGLKNPSAAHAACQPRPSGFSVCPEHADVTCCTANRFARVRDGADELSVHFAGLVRNTSPGCANGLQLLACAVCSSDQDTLVHVYETEVHISLCEAAASLLYNACLDATLIAYNQSVVRHFRTPAGFLQYLMAPLFVTPVTARGFHCYDPTLRACTVDDFTGYYTECVDNVRSAFFRPTHPGVCNGGFQPSPVHNISCSIPCDKGYYLPVGADQCVLCHAGSFSIGGGYRLESWRTWPQGLVARSFCTSALTHALLPDSECHPWVMNETAVVSGRITHNQVTTLEVSFRLVRDGHVSFDWRVNAEECTFTECDGFFATVDSVDDRAINFTSIAPLTRFSRPLAAGVHTLRLSYKKDVSLSVGADAAELRMLEIHGLFFADTACTPCPHGTFSIAGAATCQPCAADTASDEIATPDRCPHCPADSYAFPGSQSCTPRPVCSADDAEQLHTDCVSSIAFSTRTRYYAWIEPRVCMETPTSYRLPLNATVACADCQPGFRRVPPYPHCVGCIQGTHVDPSNSSVCLSCPSGTYANKSFVVSRWDSWPDWAHYSTLIPLSTTLSHYCDGAGCEREWRLMGDHVDSGVGHRMPASPWMEFSVDIETVPAVFEINATFQCSGPCELEIRDRAEDDDDEQVMWLSPSRSVGTMRVTDVGRHRFIMVFDGFSYGSATNDPIHGLVKIHSLRVTGARDGSAAECALCPRGTFSAVGQDSCTPCARGTASNTTGTPVSCAMCQGNSFAGTTGQTACLACGAGTTASADHATCVTSCMFRPTAGDELVYDLRSLVSPEMWGPLPDASGNSYFMSVCDKTDRRHMCHTADGRPVEAFVCQVNAQGVGYGLGDLMAFVPLPGAQSRDGFNLTFTHGDVCGTGVVRNVSVAFKCNPDADTGHFAMPAGHAVAEFTQCNYEFLWESLFACPVCAAADYVQLVGPCDAARSQQTITYQWRTSPKRCHGGVPLPDPVLRTCLASNTSCPLGHYAANGVCVAAPPGSFSLGNGEWVIVGAKGTVPAGFTTGCANTDCSPWAAEEGAEALKSGRGTSWLRTSITYVSSGWVSFEHKFSGSSHRAQLWFVVDGERRRSWSDLDVGFATTMLAVDPGTHAFEWLFEGGANATTTERERSAFVRNITFLGAHAAPTSPYACPSGWYQPLSGQTRCLRCPVNTRSQRGAAACSPCERNTYSLPGAAACSAMAPCSLHDDYEPYYTSCVNHTRNLVWYDLEPVHCAANQDANHNNTKPPAQLGLQCTTSDCAVGFYLSSATGACTACPRGQELRDGACVLAALGRASIPVLSFFDGFQPSPTFPFGWSTGCSGPCGTKGWRARSHWMDSGFHGEEEVDSWVSLRATFVSSGSIEFTYAVHSPRDGLDFFVDLVHQPLFRPASSGGGGSGGGTVRSERVVVPIEQPGSHHFMWVFHQTDEVEGSVDVRSVVLRGVEGGGRVGTACPTGTFAASEGSSWCQPCPPGTMAPSEGSSACTPCPSGTFQALAGQASCESCPVAGGAAGATFCTSDCLFGVDGVSYDLRALADTVLGPVRPPTSLGLSKAFFLRLCTPLNDASVCNTTSGTAVPTYVCEVNTKSGTGTSGGNLLMPEIIDGQLTLTYTGGSDAGCDAGEARKTRLVLQCDEAAALSADDAHKRPPSVSLLYADGPCHNTFSLSTYEACPVCSARDYADPGELPACQEGVATTVKVKSNACKGPRLLTTTAPCSMPLTFPLPAVVGVLAAIVLLGVGVGLLVWRNRSIHARYSSLLAQASATELTAPSHNDFDAALGPDSADHEAVDHDNVVVDTL